MQFNIVGNGDERTGADFDSQSDRSFGQQSFAYRLFGRSYAAFALSHLAVCQRIKRGAQRRKSQRPDPSTSRYKGIGQIPVMETLKFPT